MGIAKPVDINAYIARCSPEARPALKKIRSAVRAAAPDAEEIISYRMPAFRQGGILIYFAAFKAHIGVFPPVEGDEKLEAALAKYAGPKGNLRFPLGQPIPYALIGRIVRLRLKQNLAKSRPAKRKSRAMSRRRNALPTRRPARPRSSRTEHRAR